MFVSDYTKYNNEKDKGQSLRFNHHTHHMAFFTPKWEFWVVLGTELFCKWLLAPTLIVFRTAWSL